EMILPGKWSKMDRVLTNLVENAFKFTNEGSVEVRVLPKRNKIVLQVADTGIGIPRPDTERIFEKFHQVGSPLTRSRGGTGLGLPICREIVQSLGGKIWAVSTPGRGSTFNVVMPVKTITDGGGQRSESTSHR
ncbi:MAG: sensor histidine kinase, partial [Terriglobia bacterium]